MLKLEVVNSLFEVLVGEGERAAFIEPQVEFHRADGEGQQKGFEECGEE